MKDEWEFHFKITHKRQRFDVNTAILIIGIIVLCFGCLWLGVELATEITGVIPITT